MYKIKVTDCNLKSAITGERTNYEGLPNIDIRSSRTASQNGILVQDHVYKTAGGYQYFRDGLREKSLDNLQHSLDVIGTVPGLGEAADLINSGISYGRGDYVGASLSLAATVPFIGVGATVAKAGMKGGVQYTKSIRWRGFAIRVRSRGLTPLEQASCLCLRLKVQI